MAHPKSETFREADGIWNGTPSLLHFLRKLTELTTGDTSSILNFWRANGIENWEVEWPHIINFRGANGIEKWGQPKS